MVPCCPAARAKFLFVLSQRERLTLPVTAQQPYFPKRLRNRKHAVAVAPVRGESDLSATAEDGPRAPQRLPSRQFDQSRFSVPLLLDHVSRRMRIRAIFPSKFLIIRPVGRPLLMTEVTTL